MDVGMLVYTRRMITYQLTIPDVLKIDNNEIKDMESTDSTLVFIVRIMATRVVYKFLNVLKLSDICWLCSRYGNASNLNKNNDTENQDI